MNESTSKIQVLEAQLNAFDLKVRSQALTELVAMLQEGKISIPPEAEVVNMHCHTFFSFNAYGYSPTALAWLAKRQGYKLIGTVDFDVLDAVDEFLNACDQVGVRASTGLETRVFIPEFSTREINSPGEPGIFYYMVIGFTASKAPASAARILDDMRQRAIERNRGMVERLNRYLDPVTINYEKDVLPLTPGGTATERHLLAAYKDAAEKKVADPIAFWSEKFKMSPEQIVALYKDMPAFLNTVRSKLMKRGGAGYVQPDAGEFPSLEEVNEMAVECGALPCATWLDGTSTGEQAITELLELLIRKGAVALNIIPDRNWNIADPETRRIKVSYLHEVVKLSQQLDLPLNIGTEMNAHGQKKIDDFNVPELAPVRQAFIDGAYFIYGHTLMQRALQLGYQSAWAKTNLPSRKERNTFYTQVGKLTPPGAFGLKLLKALSITATPEKILTAVSAATSI